MKLIFFSCPARFTSLMTIMCALAMAMAGCSTKADSETKPAAIVSPVAPPLTEAQMKAKYQNCPGDYYSGPRPGKTRFAQNPWIWAVTPEFAKRFCMPAEFVSTELKGAEAVAFRVLRKNNVVNCGFANNSDACMGDVVTRFEIYIKSDVELPRRRDGRIYHAPDLPSSRLITTAQNEVDAEAVFVKKNPVPDSLPHFSLQQVALQGVKEGVVEWPITALGEEEHRGQVYKGIDYYAFEGLSGNFQNPRFLKLGIIDFQIMFEHLGVVRVNAQGSNAEEYAYSIKFPISFSKKMAELDMTNGRNFSREIRDAFRSRPVSSSVSR